MTELPIRLTERRHASRRFASRLPITASLLSLLRPSGIATVRTAEILAPGGKISSGTARSYTGPGRTVTTPAASPRRLRGGILPRESQTGRYPPLHGGPVHPQPLLASTSSPAGDLLRVSPHLEALTGSLILQPPATPTELHDGCPSFRPGLTSSFPLSPKPCTDDLPTTRLTCIRPLQVLVTTPPPPHPPRASSSPPAVSVLRTCHPRYGVRIEHLAEDAPALPGVHSDSHAPRRHSSLLALLG